MIKLPFFWTHCVLRTTSCFSHVIKCNPFASHSHKCHRFTDNPLCLPAITSEGRADPHVRLRMHFLHPSLPGTGNSGGPCQSPGRPVTLPHTEHTALRELTASMNEQSQLPLVHALLVGSQAGRVRVTG